MINLIFNDIIITITILNSVMIAFSTNISTIIIFIIIMAIVLFDYIN